MKFLSTAVLFTGAGDASGSSGLIYGFLFLVVAAIILGLFIWLISIAPFIPAVFKQVLTWLIYLVAVLILVNFLLGLVGHPIYAI